jgi:hypothetical protein
MLHAKAEKANRPGVNGTHPAAAAVVYGWNACLSTNPVSSLLSVGIAGRS